MHCSNLFQYTASLYILVTELFKLSMLHTYAIEHERHILFGFVGFEKMKNILLILFNLVFGYGLMGESFPFLLPVLYFSDLHILKWNREMRDFSPRVTLSRSGRSGRLKLSSTLNKTKYNE